MKRLILVVSPPACGKTYVSKELSKKLKHIVYLDKDTLIPLSKEIFSVACQPYNRSSDFFEEHIRDKEYDVILELAYDALHYDNLVLINAPFTREIRDEKFIADTKKRLKDDYNAKLTVIWVKTSVETCHQRMIERASDRDTWKLENWEEYISKVDFNIPEQIKGGDKDSLIVFNNSSNEEFSQSLESVVAILEKE